jgi:hypothetical protein
MNRVALFVAALTTLSAPVVGCGGGSSTSMTTTVTSTVPATFTEPDGNSGGLGQSWIMPNLIGKNLQDAQDAIQQLTNNEVFYTGSTDLTGQGRNQVMDRNWQVCTSTPAPGESFNRDTAIEFGVVRIDSEACP